ncbi:MAG: hypothetical protein EOO04_21890 [Chitinophagaceae bacterium]|nr:MAG: hypothetical protein EOO04_21890 [Chitinophagaceae bacterium]
MTLTTGNAGKQFFFVCQKKPELAKRNTDQHNTNRPHQRYYNDVNDPVKHLVFDPENGHQLFRQKAGKTSTNGKNTKNKDELDAADTPFIL